MVCFATPERYDLTTPETDIVHKSNPLSECMSRSERGLLSKRRKPGSVDTRGAVTVIYLVGRLPARSSGRPEIKRLEETCPCGRFSVALLRMGLARPDGYPPAGELLPHHFTLTGQKCPAVYFLLRFP